MVQCAAEPWRHNTAMHGIVQVSDFGMSRELDVKSRIETKTYGTVTHMAPELLSNGHLSKVRPRTCHSCAFDNRNASRVAD